MKIKPLLTALMAITLLGCSSMAQKGALSQAKSAYLEKNYKKCLYRLEQAEIYDAEMADNVGAQILLYKGLCLEGGDRKDEAIGVYKNLIAQYPKSSQSAQAQARIK